MELNSVSDALSGLQANQTYMDVVGNNIANVNTIGYKTQSIRFGDLMSQTLGYGSAANQGVEGTNPYQVGMGVGTGAIAQINAQGSVQNTGRLTDMAIQGGGYFILNDGQRNVYSRDGSFTVAPDGTLENGATGMAVQGWMALKKDGTVDTSSPLTAIKIPMGSASATPTSAVSLAGNLDSASPDASQYTTSMQVYDAQGNPHNLNLTMQKSSNNQWSYNIAGGSDVSITSGASGTLTFDASGKLTAPTTAPSVALTYTNGAANGSFTVDFSKISQLSQTSQVNVATSDGSSGGTISTFNVGKDGVITALYSNGTSRSVGQIALADFRNPDGLVRDGGNLYTPGVNSGTAQVGAAGVGNLGAITTGQLEGSNVDLAAQFGQMIQAQQGFNASTKVITTTNNMLQSVISIVP